MQGVAAGVGSRKDEKETDLGVEEIQVPGWTLFWGHSSLPFWGWRANTAPKTEARVFPEERRVTR